MSALDAPPSAHDLARSDIEQWRGQCLNLFARAELAVSETLQAACEAQKTVKLRHLAGQRLQDLIEAVDTLGGTKKQRAAFAEALRRWELVESRRQYFAHGVTMESLDRSGRWLVTFDFIAFRKNTAEDMRWTATQAEAEAFSSELQEGFKKLSCELGQVRSRLSS